MVTISKFLSRGSSSRKPKQRCQPFKREEVFQQQSLVRLFLKVNKESFISAAFHLIQGKQSISIILLDNTTFLNLEKAFQCIRLKYDILVRVVYFCWF